jgi:hypothetical protein
MSSSSYRLELPSYNSSSVIMDDSDDDIPRPSPYHTGSGNVYVSLNGEPDDSNDLSAPLVTVDSPHPSHRPASSSGEPMAVIYDAEYDSMTPSSVSGTAAGAADGTDDTDALLDHEMDASEYNAVVPDKEKQPYKRVMVVSISMFMGYAILISFQHKLKEAFGIGDKATSRSHEFGFAVSFLYIGNLVFRLAHNFVFFFVKPRYRVHISMGCMMLSMFILGIFVFVLDYTDTLLWVYIAYVLGGVGIGSFESNLLSAITPLGHSTKMYAVIGFPIGFAGILVGGFCLTALSVRPEIVYLITLGALACGLAMFTFGIPVVSIHNNADTFSAFVDNVKHWREWLPPISWHCIALAIDMYCVSLFSGVMLYILNGDQVPLFGPDSSTRLPHDWFFVMYNMFTLAGDSSSRKLAYFFKPRHPFWFLIASFVGAAICLSKIAIIAPIGIFLVFFANGSIYASTTRHIDTHVLKEFNLIALSFWLFVGDFGSVAGSNTISFVRDVVCSHHEHYMCTAK